MKVLVYGSGAWGKNIVQKFYDLGVLYAVCEPDLNKHPAFKHRFPDVVLESDPEVAQELPCDAVAIATPASTHYKLARKYLSRQVPTFIEKPMALSLREAKVLVDLAEQKETVLMVGHLLLYQEGVQKIKSLLENEFLGQVYSIHVKRLKLGRVRKVENVLWSFGVHDLAVITHLIDQAPYQIKVSGQSALQPGIEDDVYMHMTFKGGIQAHLHVSWCWPIVERGITLIGERGMLVFDELEQRLTFHRKQILSDLTVRDEGCQTLYEGGHDVLTSELADFLNCVKLKRTPIASGYSGLQVISILEKATKQLGRPDELLYP